MGIMHKNTASGAGVVNPGASAETIIYTTPAIGPTGPGAPVVGVSGTVNITAGTGTTAVVIKVRQTNLVTGTQVGPSQTHTLAAGNTASISFGVSDASTYLEAGGQYVVTATQTGGTGAGTTNFVDIEVLVLWLARESWAWPKWSPRTAASQTPASPVHPPCGRSSG